MTAQILFVTIGMPALVVVCAWIAVKIHEWDLKRTYGR
jgi:hypothetical protein